MRQAPHRSEFKPVERIGRYRQLRDRLARVSRCGYIEVPQAMISAVEEYILEQMDHIWDLMTDDERATVVADSGKETA